MSKIAELLKLAEKKKEDKPQVESTSNEINEVSVSKSKQVQEGVSKAIPGQVSVSNSKQKEVSVSSSKQEEVNVSSSKQEEVGVSKDISLKNTIDAKELSVSKSKQGETNVNRNNVRDGGIDRIRTPVETSPTRNFTKVSNSIIKRGIPENYFRGLSKHTYDILYQRTRGAIKPTRTIQLTKDELVRLTGLSKDAIKLHIKYLKETGLLDSRPVIGSHSGWEYEVFVLEELTENSQVGVRQGKARQGKAEQDRVSEDLPLHSGQVPLTLTHTNPIQNKEVTENSKDFFLKHNTDDEPFSGFIAKFQDTAEELTGKKLSKRDCQNLEKLADLLILELKIAARRTDNISSVPAFLTEVLRRKFFASRERMSSSAKSPMIKPDTVGKPDDESFHIKPLDEKGKQMALEQLREFAGDDFFHDFKKWYTEEDWQWIMKQLGINQKETESK